MTIASKTSLFLMIALTTIGTPLDELNKLQPHRNPLVAPLSDLKISDNEATHSIAQKIYQVFQIKNEIGMENHWLQLLLKKQEFPLIPGTPTSEDEIQTRLINMVKQSFSRIHFEKINLDNGSPSEEDSIWAVREVEEIAKDMATQMKNFMSQELLAQFNNIISSKELNVRLNLYYTIPTNVHNAIVDEINDLYKWKGDVFGDRPFDIATPFENAIQEFEDTQYADAKNVFSLFRGPASFIRLETKYLFYTSQLTVGLNSDALISRMGLLFNLLARFSVDHKSPDEINDVFNSLLLHLDNILKEKEPEDKAFTPVFNKLISKLLQSYNQFVGAEISFKQATTFFSLNTRLSMSHLSEFIRDYYKSHDLPMLSSNDIPQNSQELLRIIDAFTSLAWTELTETWWSYVLTIYDKIIGVDRQALVLNAYSKIIVMAIHTPLQGSQEFYQTVYSALLNFIEFEGSSTDLDEWNDKFDKYLNQEFEKNPLVRKYYLPIKIQNVYSTNHEFPFDLVFLPFAPDQESANQVREVINSNNLEKLRTLTWNGYGKWSNDKKKSSLDKNVFILKISGSTISSEFFQKGIFTSISHRVEKHKAKTSKPTVIRQNTPKKGEMSQLEKSESNSVSTNKILIETSETKNIPSQVQQLHSGQNLQPIPEQNEENAELKKTSGSKSHETKVKKDIEVLGSELQQPTLDSNINQDPKISSGKKQSSLHPVSGLIDKNSSSNREEKLSDLLKNVSETKFNVDDYEQPLLMKQPVFVDQNMPLNTNSKQLESSRNQPVSINVDFSNVEPKVTQKSTETQTQGNIVTELKGTLRENERKILESDNLEEILKSLGVQIDEEGNQITFTMVKIVENTTPCYQALILG